MGLELSEYNQMLCENCENISKDDGVIGIKLRYKVKGEYTYNRKRDLQEGYRII